MMTKKDYIEFANAIKENDTMVDLVSAMIDIFKEDNPNFDTDRFLTACGFDSQ